MILTRLEYLSSGIFGTLSTDDGVLICQTLEHSYPVCIPSSIQASYAPKLPKGIYTCLRGEHLLKGMAHPFITFEVTGVPGHTGILFHRGNLNADSEGCILLGMERESNVEVLGSKIAFNTFLNLLGSVETFQLTVV